MGLLDNLNDKQREAACHIDGALLVLAGAGSGKTSMMTHRIAHMILDKGISPGSILAVTFTNKAAGEMKARVEDLLGRQVNMWIMTFHSACLRILRIHIEELGYKKDFTIYDGTDQKTALKQCLLAEGLDDKIFSIPYVQKVISESKNAGMSASEFSKENADDFKGKKLAALYGRYEKLLKKNNALDFDDLIMKTVELFEKKEDILAAYQEKFQYVMVDEYQDTNYMQYKFISLLAKKRGNICVVGDDDQCIYQWRGANIQNILGFEKDFKNTAVIKLEQNYRSTSTILDAAHSVIRNNRSRKRKKLWTEKGCGEKIRYYCARDEHQEAFYISSEIDRLHGRELKYSDFAVLYRTHAQSRALEEMLSAKEIPYRILGGVRFYDRKEVKDLISYMRVVQNLSDDISLKRIINEPKRGIGDKTVEKLESLAESRGESLFSVLSDTEVIDGLGEKLGQSIKRFVQMIYRFAMEKDYAKVSDIYEGILAQTGYWKSLEEQNTVEADSRMENLLELKSVIYDYEEDAQNISLTEFLERISLITDIDNHAADEDAVVLMTLHSSKGLEFPVVFMPGMEDGLFPGRRSFDSESALEEERRLCYVGITRAKQILYMTCANQRMLYGRTEYSKPSVFMSEINTSLLENLGVPPKKERPFIQEDSGAQRFNPFDQLRYIKSQRQYDSGKDVQTAQIQAGFKDGDKVRHPKFGDGMVLSLSRSGSDIVIKVVFDDVGIKLLDLQMANLEKL